MNKVFENERTFRNINKDVQDTLEEEAAAVGGLPKDLSLKLYCECVNKLCHDRFETTPDDYEKNHQSPLRFMVKPRHYLAQFERVVYKTDEYWVIEKIEDELDQPFEI